MNFAPFAPFAPFTTLPPPHDLGNWSAFALHRCIHKATAPTQLAARLPAHAPTPAPRPLRIVRIVEAGCASANGGRMVISGRMSDVCAELDRLAAWESLPH